MNRTLSNKLIIVLGCFLGLVCALPQPASVVASNSNAALDGGYVRDTLVVRAPVGSTSSMFVTAGYELTVKERVPSANGSDEFMLFDIDSQQKNVDYDYLIGFLETKVPGACVDRDAVYGSPGSWIGSGSAYGIGQYDTPPETTARQLFESQWAFNQAGLTVADMDGNGSDTVVAILDAFQPNSADLWAPYADVSFHTPTVLPPLGMSPSAQDISVHGDMVLSLAHAVAPDSHFMQVETLNAEGVGHLFGLVEALNHVLLKFPSYQRDYLVVNMSLGSTEPDRCGLIEALLEEGDATYNVAYVAASGNTPPASQKVGKKGFAPVQPMPLYPASSPLVMAAGATNPSGSYASYSHVGEPLAPGGEIYNPMTEHGCDVEPDAILALVPRPDAEGFALYCSAGTSFSSPLVAGLASAIFSPAAPDRLKVTSHISSGAQQNDGIIDIGFTLSE